MNFGAINETELTYLRHPQAHRKDKYFDDWKRQASTRLE